MSDFPPLFDLLQASLLDLLYELRETNTRLILGGGYGLYLKQRHVRETGVRTLIDNFPQARSTNDLDLFLRTEILADPDQLRYMAEALDRLGYVVIEGEEYYHFVKRIAQLAEPDGIKIDLLTRFPPQPYIDARQVRVRAPRICSGTKGIGIHARRTDEAIAVEEEPIEIIVKGQLTTGEVYSASVFLPQAFAYAMMKLFAFRDRRDDAKKGFGRHHALDLYSIVAMMTREEYRIAQRLSLAFREETVCREAGEIVSEHFQNVESLGVLRLREHPHYSPDMDLAQFLSVLSELFALH